MKMPRQGKVAQVVTTTTTSAPRKKVETHTKVPLTEDVAVCLRRRGIGPMRREPGSNDDKGGRIIQDLVNNAVPPGMTKVNEGRGHSRDMKINQDNRDVGAKTPDTPVSEAAAVNVTAKGKSPNHKSPLNAEDHYTPCGRIAARNAVGIGPIVGGGRRRGGLPGKGST